MISSWSKRRKKTSSRPGRILVTGASGFAGRYLLALLAGAEDTVLGTCVHHKPASRPGVLWVRQDLTDELSVRKLVREFQPTEIYHLAAQSIPRLSWERREETLAVNAAGTIHLLRALRLQQTPCRFLFISTNQVYGHSFRSGKPLDEQAVVWPQNPYAASKALAELSVRDFGLRHGLDCVIARPFNHLGAGQTAQLVLSDWCRQAALAEAGRQEPQLCVGNLEAYRDFLHVEDVVRAYRLLMKSGISGEAYNICTGKSILLHRYAQALLKQARVPMQLRVEPSRFRKDDPHRMDGDPARLFALGWRPKRTAFEALEEMLSWWRGQIMKETK